MKKRMTLTASGTAQREENLWSNTGLSHRRVSECLKEKVGTVQTLSGESNRQPHSLKPTALTLTGWRRPRWMAKTAEALLSGGSH